VELDVGVEAGPGLETEVSVEAEIEVGAGVEVEVEVEVEIEICEIVSVMAPPPIVDTPPGPAQLSPLGQQASRPFVPRMQYAVGGQPPNWSGQQVQVGSIQPDPQSFMP
jgi:hypothetical protein